MDRDSFIKDICRPHVEEGILSVDCNENLTSGVVCGYDRKWSLPYVPFIYIDKEYADILNNNMIDNAIVTPLSFIPRDSFSIIVSFPGNTYNSALLKLRKIGINTHDSDHCLYYSMVKQFIIQHDIHISINPTEFLKKCDCCFYNLALFSIKNRKILLTDDVDKARGDYGYNSIIVDCKKLISFYKDITNNGELSINKDNLREILLKSLSLRGLITSISTNNIDVSISCGLMNIWSSIMERYSFQNNLSIPKITGERGHIVGGMSRMIVSGFVENSVKLDYNSMYPSIATTYRITSDCDVDKIMPMVVDKFLKLRDAMRESGDYDMQMLYKRINNNFFGCLGAEDIFRWGDSLKASQMTCIGRQCLRLLNKWFMNKGFAPITMDTDGVQFKKPFGCDYYHYRGSKGDLYGIEAYVTEFNDKFMSGTMMLGIDSMDSSMISLSKKNYCLLSNKGDISYVGVLLAHSDMPSYIRGVLSQLVQDILVNKDGASFVRHYYDAIVNISLRHVDPHELSVNLKVQYDKDEYNGEKQHNIVNEYIKKHNKTYHKGDFVSVVYVDNEDSIAEVSEQKSIKYSTKKYIALINSRVSLFLSCFSPYLRKRLIINNPGERHFFTHKDCTLYNSMMGDSTGKEDSINKVFVCDESEYDVWNRLQMPQVFAEELKNIV